MHGPLRALGRALYKYDQFNYRAEMAITGFAYVAYQVVKHRRRRR